MRYRSVLTAMLLCLVVTAASAQTWRTSVERVFGRSGTYKQNVLRFEYPRSDLSVTVNGVAIRPEFATVSMINFQQTGNRAVMTVELVLLESEVSRVLPSLRANGIGVAALHNHLLHESPRLLYLHASAVGDPAKMARGMRDTLKLTATPMGPTPAKPRSTVNWSKVNTILGTKGEPKAADVIEYNFPRREAVRIQGVRVSPLMGAISDIDFQMMGNNRAIASEEFACTPREVNRVVDGLIAHGFSVTAIHNHMITDNPRLIFVHFWGSGAPEDLARGLKSVLGRTNSGR